MTDANGTRTSRIGAKDTLGRSLGQNSLGQNSLGQNPPVPNTSGQGSDSTGPSRQSFTQQGIGGNPIKRPPLRIPSSQFLPQTPTSPLSAQPMSTQPSNRGSGASPRTDADSVNVGNKTGDKPNTRYRKGEEQPTRRSRRSRNGAKQSGDQQGTGRRRLFGTVPDRIKSKSSSRTRALKARTGTKTGQPSDKKGIRSLRKANGKTVGRASGKTQPNKTQPNKTIGAIAQKTLADTAASKRPDLPNPSYPGRVPPARGIIRKRRRSSKSTKLIRKGIQFLIVGLGIAALGGTLIKAWPNNQSAQPEETETVVTEPIPIAKTFPVTLGQEISALKTSLQELPNLYPNLTPKVFYIDVDTGSYISVEGSETIAAASTIKLPILLAFFEEVDAGRLDPNQTLAIQQQDIAEGSGDMQISPPGTQFTALEVASQMIINSDNTATNMMIGLLGGKEILNDWFQTKGLEKTVLNAPLPDLDGTNTTSAKDLVHTMLLISQGEELEMRSRDRILNILNRTYNKNLLAIGPQDQGALTYNKTGDIASVLGDVALVDLPNGKRYAIAALVERPTNDGRALEMLRRISGQTYEEAAKAIQPAVTPLGNPDGDSADSTPADSAEGTTPTGSDATPAQSASPNPAAETTVTPANAEEPEAIEEEPYPSANPRN